MIEAIITHRFVRLREFPEKLTPWNRVTNRRKRTRRGSQFDFQNVGIRRRSKPRGCPLVLGHRTVKLGQGSRAESQEKRQTNWKGLDALLQIDAVLF